MDKATLLARRLPQTTVGIPDVGSVTVRGLSRAEALEVGGISGSAAIERYLLAHCLVDPQLSEDEVVQWHESAPSGEIDAVTTAIQKLSGFGKAAIKSKVSGTGAEPGPGIRPVSGEGTEADAPGDPGPEQ